MHGFTLGLQVESESFIRLCRFGLGLLFQPHLSPLPVPQFLLAPCSFSLPVVGYPLSSPGTQLPIHPRPTLPTTSLHTQD